MNCRNNVPKADFLYQPEPRAAYQWACLLSRCHCLNSTHANTQYASLNHAEVHSKSQKTNKEDCPLVYRMPNFPKSYPKEFLDKSPKSAAICFRIVRVVAVTQDDACVVARKCVFVSMPLMLSISAHQSDRRPSLSLKLPHHFLTQWLQRAAPL